MACGKSIGHQENWMGGLPDPDWIPVPASFADFYTDKDTREYTGDFWYETDVFVPGEWTGKFMHIKALSAGYAIPQVDFRVTVHSVFRNALNMQPVSSDLLLSLVSADEADLPQGIRLDTPDSFTFDKLRVGESVGCRGNLLVFEHFNLEIDLSSAQRWQCDLAAMRIDMASEAVADAWHFTWQALNERQACLEAEISARAIRFPEDEQKCATSRCVGQAVRALMCATRSFQLDRSVLTRLIGLGSGLTPCGDDILAGYLAGLWCTAWDSIQRRQYVDKLGQVVVQLAGQTNDISRTYLYHAAHGQVSSRLEALARAIGRLEKPEQLLPVAELAMETGHTSGMDAVTGLLFGLAAWKEPEGEPWL
jgi:hypothetical protein